LILPQRGSDGATPTTHEPHPYPPATPGARRVIGAILMNPSTILIERRTTFNTNL